MVALKKDIFNGNNCDCITCNDKLIEHMLEQLAKVIKMNKPDALMLENEIEVSDVNQVEIFKFMDNENGLLFTITASGHPSRMIGNKAINEAKRFVEENYFRNIGMESVADHVNLSYSYFSNIFKREIGMSFSRYVTVKRIEIAKSMLKETGMTIDTVAINVGFVDPKHFSKVFKRFTGITPKEFRCLA